MPGSTVSLESLSSPSPSPPPPEEQHSNHSGAAGLDSGSELSELTEEEQDDNRSKEDSARSMTRKRKPRGLVPQNMWDWAKKKPEKKEKSDWRTKMIEEEEEEEQAGPAKAMEEEEEDDQGKDSGSERDVSPDKDVALSDNEVYDVDEDDLPEDEGESGDEALPRDTGKEVNGDLSGDENDYPEDADPDVPDVLQSPKPVASPDLSEDENEIVGEDEIDDDEVQDAGATTKEGSELDEDEEDIAVDDGDAPDADEPLTTEAVTPAEVAADALDVDPDATMDVDVVQPLLMSPVAVAASSIMAGATLMQPLSPSSSQPSTPSASRVSSRFPSAEPEQEQDIPSEHEVEPEPERKPSGRGGRIRKGKGRTRAARRSRATAAAEVGEIDGYPDQGEALDGDGADGDEDIATPDIDVDSDMQPAHRAEALDVLAGIELKFALLRERLYVEKMDALAWEEGLIADGTHPELLHLHAELSSRRDKRLELAARRRDYEVENVTKRRRLDEAGTYSWWTNERDELQTQMISETNGKKRRLERERKILERPQPLRRFPMPLHDVPPAPSLREIVKSSVFGIPESTGHSKRSRKETSSLASLAYPSLAPLSRGEILQDLDLFYSHRHIPVGFDPHRNMPGLMNAVLGGMPHGMDAFGMGIQMGDGPNRFAPSLPQHLPHQGIPHGYSSHPRLPHQHSAPPGALPHVSPAHLQLDQEIQMGLRQPPNLSQHPPHMQQPFGLGLGPGSTLRRSISPVPQSNGAGPSSVPTTLGGGPVPPGFATPKPNGWSGIGNKDLKRLNGENDARERERVNERDRPDRERAQRDQVERERERGQRHSVHHPVQASHHHAHNHQHHHHHVHHHHHSLQAGFTGASGSAPPPPMAGLSGPTLQTLSPHSAREFERRPRSGAQTEVIELFAPSQRPPASSTFWKGNDDPPLPSNDNQRERDRDRGRILGPLGAGTHERLMTPFTMGSSQGRQPSLPGSPRNTLGPGGGPSNPAPSLPPSRRGSWSGPPDDHGLLRPSSASLIPSGPPGSSTMSQRVPSTRIPHPPPGSSYHSPFGSPPHGNSRALPPPTSPSAFVGALRSPTRASQPGRMPLGGPLSPPPSLPLSPRLAGSPGSKRGFPIPESGNIAQIVTGASGHGPRSPPLPIPSTLLPPLPTTLGLAGGPPSRLLNSALSEKAPSQLSGLSTKVVPVDG